MGRKGTQVLLFRTAEGGEDQRVPFTVIRMQTDTTHLREVLSSHVS